MTKAGRVFVPEETVLKNLLIDDNDDLLLCDCQVLDPTTNEPVSLLTASTFNPVKVTGTLNPLPKDKCSHYIHEEHKGRTHHIEISDVTRNAFGEYDDGSFGLWLAGRTGWYEVKAAKEYKSMMKFMKEDIRIFYFVADAYKEKRKVGRGKGARRLPEFTAQDLFSKYAVEIIKNATAVEEAAKVMYGHCDFILSCMVAGKEDMSWSQNPFYRHLARKFPDVLATVKRRMFGNTGSQKAHSTADNSSTSGELRLTRERTVQDPDIISIKSSSVATSSAGGIRSRRMADRTKLGPSATTPAVSSRRIRREATADESSPEFLGLATAVQAQDENEDEDEVGENPANDDSDDARPTARKGKSALRPRSSKGLKKNRASGSHGERINDESGDELVADPPSLKIAEKRKPDSSPIDERPRKLRPSRADIDEEIDIPSSSPTSPDVDSGPDCVMTPPPSPANASIAERAVRLNHYPDPVQEDTWICALAGCMHKVYFTSRPDSQQLIKEHYKLHTYENDERVKLVQKLQAPSLPVSHLMDRVRLQACVKETAGSTAFEGYVGLGGIAGSRVAGSRFPDPVLRRL